MARTVEHEIYEIGATRLNRSEAERWLKDHDVSYDTILKLLSGTNTDAANLVRLIGKRCYMAFEVGLNPNISKVREDIKDYIDHILESKHGSVLEHVFFNFAVEGVSRVLTAELNRHRAGVAISEGSMRFIRFEDIPYWLPISIREDASDSPELAHKKQTSRYIFERAFEQAEQNYAELCKVWADELAPESKFSKKKEITSMIRRPVPIGVATGGVWSFNLRALRHVCTMRADGPAEEEINSLATKLLKHCMRTEIHFFGDFEQNKKGFYQPKHYKV